VGHFLQKWRPHDTWEGITKKRGSRPNSEMSALTVAAIVQGQDNPVKMMWD